MKRLIGAILAIAVVFSSFVICHAETISFTSSTKKTVWEKYGVSCTLNKPGKKNATVKVGLASSKVSKYGYYAADILMKDENNNVIWAEDDSIVAKKSYWTYRTYKLGKDHKVYKLFFRPSTKELNASAYITVSEPKNCTLSMCYDKTLN